MSKMRQEIVKVGLEDTKNYYNQSVYYKNPLDLLELEMELYLLHRLHTVDAKNSDHEFFCP